MAKRKYKPYPSRKQNKNRRVQNVALVVIVLIVAVVIFNRTYKSAPETPEQTDNQNVSLNDILPSKAEEPADNQQPITILNPAVASAQPVQTPEPEPISTPPTQPVQEAPLTTDVQQPEEKPAIQEPVDVPDSTTDESSSQAKELVEEALRLRDTGKIIQARELLSDTLNEKLSPNLRSAVKSQLSKLAEQWLFSNEVLVGDKLTGYYQVQRGDNLERIAKNHKVPYEVLMDINGISRPESLQANQTIKVIHGPFNVVVYKNNFTMDLYLQSRYVKTYRVGLGRAEHETPSGRWRVESGGKLITPTWTDPDTGRRYVADDPDYPLGSRWIAIEGIDDNTRKRTGFAIHGTKDPDSIGTRSSRGCIRLHNGNAIEVYNMLAGGISEVLIVD